MTSDLVEGVLPSKTAGVFEFLKVRLRLTYVLVETMPNDLRPCRGRLPSETAGAFEFLNTVYICIGRSHAQ
jgi:hypothetical protein